MGLDGQQRGSSEVGTEASSAERSEKSQFPLGRSPPDRQ